ncbi:hypothetical protein EJB05_43620 [Eragrostis curvula]|uniref:Uncharacterized protein n=1 Tax=Eragrostis curvula TaxID=38414 RepID=A0A5J9TFP6_9POAL|nr:hypothetical protein EJB05_43620 [Eragrostis curvula]
MAMLSLLSLMGMQRRRRRRPLRRRGIRAHDGSVVSGDERTKGPPCDHDENSQGDKRTRYSAPTLPEVQIEHKQ